MTKEECLSRYHANADKRRILAQHVIDGKRTIGTHWPKWQQYDVLTEIAMIKQQREEAKAD